MAARFKHNGTENSSGKPKTEKTKARRSNTKHRNTWYNTHELRLLVRPYSRLFRDRSSTRLLALSACASSIWSSADAREENFEIREFFLPTKL